MLVFNTDLAYKRMQERGMTPALASFYNRAAHAIRSRMSFLKGERQRLLIFSPHVISALVDGVEEMDTTWVHLFNDDMAPYSVDRYDIIISFHHLHWVNDVPGFLKQCGDLLKPQGWLVGVCVGGNTLSELRESCNAAAPESYVHSGAWQLSNGRMSPFMYPRDMAGLLQRAQLGSPVCDVEREELIFHHASHLIQQIRLNGLSHCSIFESPLLKQKELEHLEVYYDTHFRNKEGSGVVASVESIFFTAQSHAHYKLSSSPASCLLGSSQNLFRK